MTKQIQYIYIILRTNTIGNVYDRRQENNGNISNGVCGMSVCCALCRYDSDVVTHRNHRDHDRIITTCWNQHIDWAIN